MHAVMSMVFMQIHLQFLCLFYFEQVSVKKPKIFVFFNFYFFLQIKHVSWLVIPCWCCCYFSTSNDLQKKRVTSKTLVCVNNADKRSNLSYPD